MKYTVVVLIAGVCIFAGAAWFWQGRPGVSKTVNTQSVSSDVAIEVNLDSSVATENLNEAVTLSPFTTDTAPTDLAIVASTGASNEDTPVTLAVLAQTSLNAGRQPLHSIDVMNLGRSTMSDDEFLHAVDVLRDNPQLLQQLIDEFRQETDIERRSVLARILGDVGGDSASLTASELIYSGDAESRQLGLQMLQRIQPGNAAAREIASTLLATEVEPAMLVGTLTSLAKPGTVDVKSRQFLSEQVAFLTDHENASVRSTSLDILSRWSNDGRYTEVLRNGLADRESLVRESAAYALVGHQNVTQNLIESLLSVAVDPSEDKRARSGAILALQGMPIDSSVRQQVAAAQLELNRIRR